MRQIWIIEEGMYYDDRSYNVVACKTKKIAVKKCRDEGFSYSVKEDLWSNDSEREWRHVFSTEFHT